MVANLFKGWISKAILIGFLALQYNFWLKTNEIRPDMSIVPDVPGEETVQALSFGDEHAFFRLLGLQIQNAGDTYGRFTALYKYDYNKLYHWFRLLDSLDDTSNYIPSMATYYYSQTQRKSDVKYIVDYLQEHSEDRLDEKWWWMVQAVYLANHKLNDLDLALKLARKLEGVKGAPLWVNQMPAFIYEQRGEYDAALGIIDRILDSVDEIEGGELNFMQHFVEERLEKLGELTDEIDAKRAQNAERAVDGATEPNEKQTTPEQ